MVAVLSRATDDDDDDDDDNVIYLSSFHSEMENRKR